MFQTKKLINKLAILGTLGILTLTSCLSLNKNIKNNSDSFEKNFGNYLFLKYDNNQVKIGYDTNGHLMGKFEENLRFVYSLKKIQENDLSTIVKCQLTKISKLDYSPTHKQVKYFLKNHGEALFLHLLDECVILGYDTDKDNFEDLRFIYNFKEINPSGIICLELVGRVKDLNKNKKFEEDEHFPVNQEEPKIKYPIRYDNTPYFLSKNYKEVK